VKRKKGSNLCLSEKTWRIYRYISMHTSDEGGMKGRKTRTIIKKSNGKKKRLILTHLGRGLRVLSFLSHRNKFVYGTEAQMRGRNGGRAFSQKKEGEL